MPLENNIKVESHVSIKDKIKVNIVQVDPYRWISLTSRDEGDGTIWVKDPYDPDRALSIGSANVTEFTNVDLSELDINTPGTYPVYTTFKDLNAEYQIEVKAMEMAIACSGMTTDYVAGEAPEFDGDCYATYSKESLDKYVNPNVSFATQVAGQRCLATASYTDNFYDISATDEYTVNIHYPIDENSVVIDFKTDIPDFDEWEIGYHEHTVDFGYVIGKIKASHQGEEQPINDEPVIKDGPVEFETDEPRRYIDGISLSLTQWGTKAKAVTMKYSEDRGLTWTSVPTVTSSDFWLRGWIPEGVYATNIGLEFPSNANNQCGLHYGVIYTHLEDHPIHRVTITGLNSVSKDDIVTWTANCIVPEESMEWEVVSGDGEVTLDPYSEEDPSTGNIWWKCDITGVSSGSVIIRATCEEGTYDEKELTIIGGGVHTYTGSVTFSDIYSTDKTIVDGDEIDIIEEGESSSLGNIKIQFNKAQGGTAPTYYTSGAAIRAYAKNTFTIYFTDSGTRGSINSISMVCGSGSSTSNKCTANVGIINSGKWATGAGTNNWVNNTSDDVKSVTFTEGGTSGNIRFVSMTVNYTIND